VRWRPCARRTVRFQPPLEALHQWIISGNLRQFFQSFLPQLKLRHGLESGNGKNLFPTIRPVVAKERFRGVPAAGFAPPRGLEPLLAVAADFRSGFLPSSSLFMCLPPGC